MEVSEMEYLLILVALLIGLVLFEYRIRRPDTLLLYERSGEIRARTARFYPRHFSLPLATTVRKRPASGTSSDAGDSCKSTSDALTPNASEAGVATIS